MYLKETLLLSSLAAAALPQAEITELFQTEDWNTLKTIWNTLNRAKPVDDYYNFPIAPEKGDSITAELNRLFQAGFTSPELTVSIEFIRNLTAARTMRLSRMNPLMMTRMMPSWTATVQDGILFNFEERITALSELLAEDEISATQYIAARDSLLEKALTLALLEMVNGPERIPLYDYPFLEPPETNVDSILHRLDMSYSAALDTLNKAVPSDYADHYKMIVEQHEAFAQQLQDFREAAPVFRILLTELMEAQR